MRRLVWVFLFVFFDGLGMSSCTRPELVVPSCVIPELSARAAGVGSTTSKKNLSAPCGDMAPAVPVNDLLERGPVEAYDYYRARLISILTGKQRPPFPVTLLCALSTKLVDQFRAKWENERFWFRGLRPRDFEYFTGLDRSALGCDTGTFLQRRLVVDSPQNAERFMFHGDMHGDAWSLKQFFEREQKNSMQPEGVLEGFKIIDPTLTIVYLGDYIDRSEYSTETLLGLMLFSFYNPGQVVLLRGNHETSLSQNPLIFQNLGEELTRFCSIEYAEEVSEALFAFFGIMPAAYLITVANASGSTRRTVLCCHGGIDEDCDVGLFIRNSNRDEVFMMIPFATREGGNQCGFLWNDFDPRPGFDKNFEPGTGRVVYCQTETEAWCQKHGIDCIIRSHQHSDNPNDPMMLSMIGPAAQTEGHYGLSKLWGDSSSCINQVWPGMVCTFMLSPITAVGEFLRLSGTNFCSDVYATLVPKGPLEEWTLETKVFSMPSSPPPSRGSSSPQMRGREVPVDEFADEELSIPSVSPFQVQGRMVSDREKEPPLCGKQGESLLNNPVFDAVLAGVGVCTLDPQEAPACSMM